VTKYGRFKNQGGIPTQPRSWHPDSDVPFETEYDEAFDLRIQLQEKDARIEALERENQVFRTLLDERNRLADESEKLRKALRGGRVRRFGQWLRGDLTVGGRS
jgi:hypothetical protein